MSLCRALFAKHHAYCLALADYWNSLRISWLLWLAIDSD